MPTWAANYIGIPFKENGRDFNGMDCYGLLRHVQINIFKRNIPSLNGMYNSVWDKNIPDICIAEAKLWNQIVSDNISEGDVLLFNIKSEPRHVAVAIDNKRMLHILKGTDACIESYRAKLWAPRLAGAYRWKE